VPGAHSVEARCRMLLSKSLSIWPTTCPRCRHAYRRLQILTGGRGQPPAQARHSKSPAGTAGKPSSPDPEASPNP